MDYTTSELFIVDLAREIKDGDKISLAVEVPLCLIAWLLAKETHAPNSSSWTLAGGIDPEPTSIPLSTGDPALIENALSILDLSSKVGMVRFGRYDSVFLSGVQIDKYGNVNNSLVGTPERVKVRLPGGAGGAELIHIFKRVVLYRSKHNRQCFVEKVDFITYPGWIESVTWRRGGPERVITNLAVMDFNTEDRRMRLVSVHPGVSVDEVVQNTGFELVIPSDLGETPPPTKEELDLIRNKIDPENLRDSQFIR